MQLTKINAASVCRIEAKLLLSDTQPQHISAPPSPQFLLSKEASSLSDTHVQRNCHWVAFHPQVHFSFQSDSGYLLKESCTSSVRFYKACWKLKMWVEGGCVHFWVRRDLSGSLLLGIINLVLKLIYRVWACQYLSMTKWVLLCML